MGAPLPTAVTREELAVPRLRPVRAANAGVFRLKFRFSCFLLRDSRTSRFFKIRSDLADGFAHPAAYGLFGAIVAPANLLTRFTVDITCHQNIPQKRS